MKSAFSKVIIVGGIMSLSAKDPIFRAAPATAKQDVEGIGEFCLRCHAPPLMAGAGGFTKCGQRRVSASRLLYRRSRNLLNS